MRESIAMVISKSKLKVIRVDGLQKHRWTWGATSWQIPKGMVVSFKMVSEPIAELKI